MSWTRPLILCLLALFCLTAVPAPSLVRTAQAQDEQAVYKQAKADYKWLTKHKKARGVYTNWTTLADRFARIYTAHPSGPLAPGALLWTARVHAGAWRQFKRDDDLYDAQDLLKRLVNHFPRSNLADDAQLMLAGLHEEMGQPKQAYLEYLRLTVNYPRGDMVPKAKRRLDALEKELAAAAPPSGQETPPSVAEPADQTRTRAAAARTAEDKAEQERLSSLAGVTALRHWSTPSYTRVVLSLERPVPYTTNLLKKDADAGKPRRLYMDLQGARLTEKVKETVPISDGLLKRARAGQFTTDTVRLVLDIKQLASYKVFTLDNPFRVVIDCFGEMPKAKAQSKAHKQALKVPRGRAKEEPPKVGLAQALGLGIKRVVIDPGHGGKDPGCMWKGLKEKNITLDIARRVKPKLESVMGCQVLLTRTRDQFLDLEERTAFANTKDADLFVSIHVNAAASHRLNGVETYFLNLASDEESMRVAARENATTQRSISDLQVILNDLMLNSKINESNRLARSLHDQMLVTLRKKRKVRDLKVKQAPFYVLIGARMPAVLVEVGFLTNPTEHRLLGSRGYRDHIAQAIAEGIAAYAKQLKGDSI